MSFAHFSSSCFFFFLTILYILRLCPYICWTVRVSPQLPGGVGNRDRLGHWVLGPRTPSLLGNPRVGQQEVARLAGQRGTVARKDGRRFGAEIRGSERQRLNGRQMQETSLPLLTGGRSRGTELSKDRSLGDRRAAGPGSKVWCPGAETEQGVKSSLPCVQTLLGPGPERLQDT